jgi:hypothetical protein
MTVFINLIFIMLSLCKCNNAGERRETPNLCRPNNFTTMRKAYWKKFLPHTSYDMYYYIYNIAQAAAFYCVYEVAFCTFPSRKRLLGYNTTNLEVSKLELCVCFSRRNFHEFVHT